jgi:hypothetical protein
MGDREGGLPWVMSRPWQHHPGSVVFVTHTLPDCSAQHLHGVHAQHAVTTALCAASRPRMQRPAAPCNGVCLVPAGASLTAPASRVVTRLNAVGSAPVLSAAFWRVGCVRALPIGPEC